MDLQTEFLEAEISSRQDPAQQVPIATPQIPSSHKMAIAINGNEWEDAFLEACTENSHGTGAAMPAERFCSPRLGVTQPLDHNITSPSSAQKHCLQAWTL